MTGEPVCDSGEIERNWLSSGMVSMSSPRRSPVSCGTGSGSICFGTTATFFATGFSGTSSTIVAFGAAQDARSHRRPVDKKMYGVFTDSTWALYRDSMGGTGLSVSGPVYSVNGL